MKRLILLIALFFTVKEADAQDVMGGYMLDTIYMLPDVQVRDRFKNDTDRYRYNQLKFYVTTVLPYVNAATKIFREVDMKLNEQGVGRKEKRAYVNSREDEVRLQFEERIKKLNVTQGRLLVKLIARQTELNIYQVLKEFKNPMTAVKWQAWARMNGMNLDKVYDPEEEHTLERIMEDLGYPLPVGYGMSPFVNGK